MIYVGIYKIRNLVNNKSYYGSSKDLEERKKQHFELLRNNKHQIKLQNSYNKYGESNFVFEVVEIILETKENLLEIEQRYLDFLRPYDRNLGYNICTYAKGGDTFTNNPNKEEIRKKLCNNKNRDKLISKIRIERGLAKGKNNPRYMDMTEFHFDIIDNYVNKLRTLKEIGEMFHCSRDIIRRVLEENDIHIRDNSESHKIVNPHGYNPKYKDFTNNDIKKIIFLYKVENKTLSEIGRLFSCGRSPISRILKEN